MSEARPLHPELLLAHTIWVRRLARCLVRGDAAADDVAQQTLLVALAESPRDATRPRPWLARIARRIAGRMARSDDRRERRERIAAAPEATPGAAEVVVRASVQRAVVDAVLGLPEPCRIAVLLRFFDDLPPREIAAQLGDVPVETVRTRIKRGVELLRERLAGQQQGIAALAGIGSAVSSAGGTLVGATVVTTMNAKVLVTTAVALVAVAGAGSWIGLTSRISSGEDRGVAAGSAVDRAGVAAAPPAPIPSSRTPEPARAIDAVVDDAPVIEGADVLPRTDPPWLAKLAADLVAADPEQTTIGDDLGPETRAAFLGLQQDQLDPEALAAYVASRLEECWIVPGSPLGMTDDPDRQVSWRVAYLNSGGTPSVADLRVNGRNVTIELRVHTWGCEIAPEFDRTTAIRVSLFEIAGSETLGSGQLGIYPKFRAGVPVAETMQRMEKEHRAGTLAWLAFRPDSARMTCSRTGAQQTLSMGAVSRYRDLHRRCRAEAAKLRTDAATKQLTK